LCYLKKIIMNKIELVFTPSNYNLEYDETISFCNDEIMCSFVYNNLLILGYSDGKIQIINIDNYELEKTLEYHKGCVYSLFVDNDELFSVSADKTIRCYDLEKNKLKYSILAHNNQIYSIFVKDNYFVTSSLDRTIKIWDRENKKILSQIITGEKTAWSLIIKDDKVYSGFSDGSIKIWELSSGRLLFGLHEHEAGITNIIRKENHFISSSKDGKIKIYDNDNNLTLIKNIDVSKYQVGNIFFDSGNLISISDDKAIKVFDSNYQEINSLSLKNSFSNIVSTFDKIICSGNDGKINIINKIPKYSCENIDLNFNIPKKSPFDTKEEYDEKRNYEYNKFLEKIIAYDYIKIGHVEIIPENYDIDNLSFKIKVKVTCIKVKVFSKILDSFFANLKISPEEAKNISKKTVRNLYIKYSFGEKLTYELIINDGYKKYILEIDNKIEKKDKFDLSKDRLKINKIIYDLPYKIAQSISKNTCNNIDISDTFRNPFENTNDFYKRISNKLLNYKEINIGKIDLISEEYSIEKEVFPIKILVTCEKILNIINLDKKYDSFIKIDRFSAKALYEENAQTNLYICFLIQDNKLYFELFIYFDNKKFFVS